MIPVTTIPTKKSAAGHNSGGARNIYGKYWHHEDSNLKGGKQEPPPYP